MKKSLQWTALAVVSVMTLTGCVSARHNQPDYYVVDNKRFSKDYSSRLPSQLDTGGKKTVLVDPDAHAWGAYDANGNLVKSGLATAGGTQCPPDDAGTPSCKTGIGKFKITRMGDGSCVSKVYPRPQGGGLMPYCMFFNNGEALHGAPDNTVIEANVSHGCVRMRVQDAEWMRKNFAEVGTTVIVLPY
jgi:lipoprotein-anchoring transpeptidase ErfK/SrfK